MALAAYRIGAYLVTVAEYRRFGESDGYMDPRYWTAGGFRTKRAGQLGGAAPVPEPAGRGRLLVRGPGLLPLDGGHVTLGGRVGARRAGCGAMAVFLGDERPDRSRCNYGGNVGHPTSVGVYPEDATAEGVHNIAGNVWEWTGSLWGTKRAAPDFRYPYVAHDGREDLGAGQHVLRVLRGGDYYVRPWYVRCSYRNRDFPVNRSGLIGFRVVVCP